MQTKRLLQIGMFALGLIAFIAASPVTISGQQSSGAQVRIDADDIGGVVTSTKGPEAGVWVIAEATDLPTRFAKMVVTDDQGRYVLPDLPKANYSIWVRGYGLVDSPKIKATPGKIVNLKAVVAPNEAAAAEYYPAIYWYSMLKIPDASEFGGKGAIPDKITQSAWLNAMKNNGCVGCHQMGTLSTRTFPREVPHPLGKFANSEEAWLRRIQSGQSGEQMFNQLVKELGAAPIKLLRGLDGPHRQGRAAPYEAGTAARCRAQYRRYHLGLAQRQALHSRPDRLGSALPERQRQWPALRFD